jgi:hypothetical protein
MSVGESLRRVLQSGRDWQRVSVKGVPGVFVVKAPAYRGRPASLIIEVNPLGPDGTPMKRRGLMLRSLSELRQFREIISAKRLEEVLEAVEKVNPKTSGREDEELEI